MSKIAVILAGCGVYDGSEIHEAVFTLLHLKKAGHSYQCFAPNKDQLHVIDHLRGEEVDGQRNVLIESARIARGEIQDLQELSLSDFDGVAIPGGFGAAKNLNQWAMKGPNGPIDSAVKACLLDAINSGKPVLALCMGPTVVAKALEGSKHAAKLSVGTTSSASPYDIQGISDGMASLGQEVEMVDLPHVCTDAALKIVSAPCYMMEGDIAAVFDNVENAVGKYTELLQG